MPLLRKTVRQRCVFPPRLRFLSWRLVFREYRAVDPAPRLRAGACCGSARRALRILLLPLVRLRGFLCCGRPAVASLVFRSSRSFASVSVDFRIFLITRWRRLWFWRLVRCGRVRWFPLLPPLTSAAGGWFAKAPVRFLHREALVSAGASLGWSAFCSFASRVPHGSSTIGVARLGDSTALTCTRRRGRA